MRNPFPTRLATAAAAGVAVAALALSGCAAPGAADPADGRIHIVASTGVWGDIAATVGGDAVHVETIINEPGMDPHEYQTTPTDMLAVTKADLVVRNGGGYDQFMASILATSGVDIPSVDAYTLWGEQNGHAPEDDHEHADHGHADHGHSHAENEHVWFDLATVDAVAAAVAEQLGALDPARAATFDANAADLHAELLDLTAEADAIRAAGPRPVIATEPVTHHLLAQAGIEDLTPPDFGEAVEQGTDPAPAVIAEIRSRLDDGEASALVYNIQTESPTTASIRTAAEKAGLPVVLVSESLPEGEHYVAWVRQVLDSLRAAVVAP